jgi:putative redox protein
VTSDISGETIVVDETGNRDFQVEVKAGSSTLLMDEPVQAGGLGSGPNPYDLLSAAIGSCTLMTIRLHALHKQWPLERVRLKVTHHRDSLQTKDRFGREIELHGLLDEAPASEAARCFYAVPRAADHGAGLHCRTRLADAPLEAVPTTLCEHSRDAVATCEQ